MVNLRFDLMAERIYLSLSCVSSLHCRTLGLRWAEMKIPPPTLDGLGEVLAG